MSIPHMSQFNLYNKRVLIRTDLNVPIQNGQITSDARILAALPTIKMALENKAKVIIMSHLGRPIEGKINILQSLYPIYKYIKKLLPTYIVEFSNTYLDNSNLNVKELMILENVRFNIGEKDNDISLAKKYANLCDIFIMDAFATAHRKESSTHQIINYSKRSCIGLLFNEEIKALSKYLIKPKRPMVAIVGGAKVSTKFNVLNSLANIADSIIVGGGIANTFIAIDHNVGQSLYEPEYVEKAQKLRKKHNFLIPVDSHVTNNQNNHSHSIIKTTCSINNNEEIMDIGPKSIQNIIHTIKKAKTILWNGPLGVFEIPQFRTGTAELAYAIANSSAFSIAGGGDTLSVIDLLNIKNNISYISTGGGAFLEFIEGKKLPVLAMLETKYNK
ncbi:MAG: phosphoglycerate kinase [Buchnera aphidicola (Eriosoma harunire)]